MAVAHSDCVEKWCDIRQCIDYKMNNAIMVLMEYAMRLGDGLLTELENYLWFRSLDAASGFRAIPMTQRTREISAFVCALGYFEWVQMPFGLKNGPMIYPRIIDNSLWGYVQPRGDWASYAEKVRRAEATSATQRGRLSDPDQPTSNSVNTATKFEADNRALAESDPLQDLINRPPGATCLLTESDESTLTPVFDLRSFMDNIGFGGTTFDDCIASLSRLLARFTECRISIIFTKGIFVQPVVDFLSHEVSQHGIRAYSAKLAAIPELPFPTSKKGMQGFLDALNYYSLFIQNMAVYGTVLYQLNDAEFADGGDLAATK
ncbi:unnamed protein product [Phytophthora fragariaefolia]|uniref:Unnamed protein product n=1 Tax=Phytophthora fragariaefolia TaxID=1490495 RepID=A0A9W7CLL3_9STRA|nr:unnamed protein product [Phytophthora fragariaefolia]